MVTVRVAAPSSYPWIAERARLLIGPDFQALEAVDATGRILGMVGYDGQTPNAVCMHVALDHASAGRHLIVPAFHAAFVGLGKALVIGRVLSSNAKALRLDLHLGFREAGRLRDAWEPGTDIVLLEMRREECRWLERARKAA